LAATFLLAGCSNFFPYEYVELTGENVEVAEMGRPPPPGYFRFGGRIPMRYALEEPGVSLTLEVGEGGWPNLDIVSTVPIRAVSTEKGYPERRSAFEYHVVWGLHAADVVEISIDLEDRTDAVLITGVIVESGKVFDCVCSL
jgi:hypothetical protein